jgi:hypothetical protein
MASNIASNSKEFFGLLLPVIFAALFVGIFLGFLFGIPKLNKHYFPSEHSDRRHKYKANTNLEYISDWLSIIIVGIILTQASSFPGYLESIAASILANNDCNFNCDYARTIIISEIIFFTISGFITGYFYTRLYIPDLFSIISENEQQNAEIKIWKEAYSKASGAEIQDSENKKSKTNLSSLTEDEQEIIKAIFLENNNYVVRQPLSYKEHAAVNVLLEKGIVKEIEGGSFRTGATLIIIDKNILEELKE